MTSLCRDRAVWWLTAIFFMTAAFINPYIRGDGNGYYAYIRSLVIDGDLHFENEFRRGDPAFRRTVFDDRDQVRADWSMVGGHVRNQWAVGPSLLWAPFFLLAHGFVRVLSPLGVSIPADGYSWPYRWLCGAGTAFYAFMGLVLAYRVARRLSSAAAAFVATVAIWFASSLPVYAYFVPFHVHALASFSVALFVWYWFRMEGRQDVRGWAVWGALGGLAVEVYQLNAVFLLIPLAELVREATGGGGGVRWQVLKRTSSHALAFGVCAIVALGPHLVIKWRIHGSPWRSGYADQFYWKSPRVLHVALSPEHGLFLWTPVLALALAGLVLFLRRHHWAGGVLGATFIAYYYVVASYQNWHGQSSFGNRFFVSLTPVFVVGLATLVQVVGGGRSTRVAAGGNHTGRSFAPSGPFLGGLILLGALVVWNAGFMFQWGANIVPNRGPVDLRVVAMNQLTVVPAQLPRLFRRYFVNRDTMVRDVEGKDLGELKSYHLRR